MNLADLRAQIEEERTWRQDEIRFFQNRLAGLDQEEDRNQFRRALILMLYAHFEGFCKFCFSLYVNAINKEGITCNQANYAIAAAALASIFRELRDPNKKSDEFRRPLPDESKIHRFAREREFLEQTDDFGRKLVNIPEHVVDTESNLTPIVLRKNLYRLGFSHTQFDEFEGSINRLLATRNRIAHGDSRRGVDAKTYSELHTIVLNVMQQVTIQIMQALVHKAFMRASLPTTASSGINETISYTSKDKN